MQHLLDGCDFNHPIAPQPDTSALPGANLASANLTRVLKFDLTISSTSQTTRQQRAFGLIDAMRWPHLARPSRYRVAAMHLLSDDPCQ